MAIPHSAEATKTYRTVGERDGGSILNEVPRADTRKQGKELKQVGDGPVKSDICRIR